MIGHRWTAAVASAAALALTGAPAAQADTQTLSVQGAGSVQVAPDEASLTISVQKTAASRSSALSAANRRTNEMVKALRGLGLAANAIQTQEISVSSSIVRIRKHRVRRYMTSESLSVTVTKVSLLGSVIDAATRHGADSVDGPSFSFSDPSAGKIAATRAAIADARRRADDAAAAIGYKVTGVQSIALDPQSEVVPLSGAGGSTRSVTAPKASTPTSVNPGTEEVDAQVDVVYTIAPA